MEMLLQGGVEARTMPRESFLRNDSSDRVAEDFQLDRLDQVQREAGAAGIFDVLFAAVAADRDPLRRALALEHLAHQVVTAAVRQADVADDQVELVLVADLQRGLV